MHVPLDLARTCGSVLDLACAGGFVVVSVVSMQPAIILNVVATDIGR